MNYVINKTKNKTENYKEKKTMPLLYMQTLTKQLSPERCLTQPILANLMFLYTYRN